MRKFAFLALWFVLVLPAFAQQQPPILQAFERHPTDWDKVQVKLQKLAANLYMIQFVSTEGNAGGNASALVGDDGIVLVDTPYIPVAAHLDAALKMISDKPVKYLVNTHWHMDHTGSNAYFAKSATIIAQDNVRRRMQAGDDPSSPSIRVNLLRDVFPPFPADALPVVTFSDEMTLHVNGEEVRIVHFPKGHTDGDSVVFFMQSKVVHMGSDFVSGRAFPGIDMDNDGTGGPQGQVVALQYVLDHMPDDVKVIPAHGGLASKLQVTQIRPPQKHYSGGPGRN